MYSCVNSRVQSLTLTRLSIHDSVVEMQVAADIRLIRQRTPNNEMYTIDINNASSVLLYLSHVLNTYLWYVLCTY